MKKDLKIIFHCPYCSHDLDFISQEEREDQVIQGEFICGSCQRSYKIDKSIPNFLPDELRKKQGAVQCELVWKPGPISKFITKFTIDNAFRFKPENQGFNLDIGCGERGLGSVNIDICLPESLPRNFVLASAELLPFKDNVFDNVLSGYVIEHLVDPARYIKEQVRISKKKVIIITDNSEWLGDYWFRLINTGRIFHQQHCYKWSVEYLDNLIKRLGYKATVRACDFSTSLLVHWLSCLGKLPRIANFFYRDIIAEIDKGTEDK